MPIYPSTENKEKKLEPRPWWSLSGHMDTVIPFLFKPGKKINYTFEEFHLTDGDEITLNWLINGSTSLVILIPGLESNAKQNYIKNLAYLVFDEGFDVLVPDHRGCGEKPNSKYRSYHSGNSEDLKDILDSKHLHDYKSISIVGFSLGGSILLNYLLKHYNEKISSAFTVSAPLDLMQASVALESNRNRIYRDRFLRSLKKRILLKAQQYPDKLNPSQVKKAKTIRQLDELYTSKAHGFFNAENYYTQCSAIYGLGNIKNELYIINAKNDPFIPIPMERLDIINKKTNLHLILTDLGGHVGFCDRGLSSESFYERFILDVLLKDRNFNNLV